MSSPRKQETEYRTFFCTCFGYFSAFSVNIRKSLSHIWCVSYKTLEGDAVWLQIFGLTSSQSLWFSPSAKLDRLLMNFCTFSTIFSVSALFHRTHTTDTENNCGIIQLQHWSTCSPGFSHSSFDLHITENIFFKWLKGLPLRNCRSFASDCKPNVFTI